MGENCQHLLLIGACFIQCWCCCACTYMSSIIPPFPFCFFSPLLGVGYQGRGWVLSMNEEGRRIEYFVIVQSEGDSMYISILYICDKKKCVGFLCDTTFYLYYGSTFSVSVLIIYIWFVFLFFCFFDFVSVISCNFFPSYICLRFCLLHGLLLLLSDEVTQLLFVFV